MASKNTKAVVMNGSQPRYSFSSSDSSNMVSNENGWNGQPANSANLENDSTQARRRECNMALVPSIHTRMAIAANVSIILISTIGMQLTEEEPGIEANNNHNDTEHASLDESQLHCHAPQDNTELLMSE